MEKFYTRRELEEKKLSELDKILDNLVNQKGIKTAIYPEGE